MDLSVFRSYRNRFVQYLNGLTVIIGLRSKEPQEVQRLKMIGLYFENGFANRPCLGQFSSLLKYQCLTELCLYMR